jgi:hypothetical protein
MRRGVLLMVAAGVVAGCSCGEPESLEDLTAAERADLAVVDYKGARELLAKHKGKVLVLTGWMVGRGDFAALYDGLAGLAKPDAETGPVVVAMNFDGVAMARAKVLPLIRKTKPPFESCVFEGEQMMLLKLVDQRWGGALPALWVYDAEGELQASFYGEKAVEQARPKVEELAAEPTRKR